MLEVLFALITTMLPSQPVWAGVFGLVGRMRLLVTEQVFCGVGVVEVLVLGVWVTVLVEEVVGEEVVDEEVVGEEVVDEEVLVGACVLLLPAGLLVGDGVVLFPAGMLVGVDVVLLFPVGVLVVLLPFTGDTYHWALPHAIAEPQPVPCS